MHGTLRRLVATWFITFRTKSSEGPHERCKIGSATKKPPFSATWSKDSYGNYWKVTNFARTKPSFWRKFLSDFATFLLFHHFYWSLFAILWFLWFGLYQRNRVILTVSAIYLLTWFGRLEYGSGLPCSTFCRSAWWKLVFEYFPVIVYQQVEHETASSDTIIVCCHPHGVMAVSRILLYGFLWETLFPQHEKRRALAARPLFYLPVCREFTLWSGGIDACRYSALTSLNSGNSIFVFPGGSEEIFVTRRDNIYVLLEKRKGFIRLALETGSNLVPVLAVGEEELFRLFRLVPERLQQFFLHYFRLPVGVALGSYCTCMPERSPLQIVVGRAITVHAIENPSKEDIDSLHAVYKERLVELYRDFKTLNTCKDKSLVIL
ncbi:2-acylglycerol O-acyltransferase 2 [Galdieria sulphuraria]|nr:2-acylglycerol O-acyltransferase 2 [Galdieria sulphuraria]